MSDPAWRSGAGPAGHGPTVMADIYNGETFNESMRTPGWSTPAFDEAGGSDWVASQRSSDIS